MLKTLKRLVAVSLLLALAACSDNGVSPTANLGSDTENVSESELMRQSSFSVVETDFVPNDDIKKLLVVLWDGYGKDGTIKDAYNSALTKVLENHLNIPVDMKYINDRGQTIGQTKAVIDRMREASGYSHHELGLVIIGKSMGGAKTYKMVHDYHGHLDDYKRVSMVLIDAHEGGAPGNQGISGKWYDYVHLANNTSSWSRDYDLSFLMRHGNYGSKLRIYNTYQRDDGLKGYTFTRAYRNIKQNFGYSGHSRITTTDSTKKLIGEALLYGLKSDFHETVDDIADIRRPVRIRNRLSGEYLHMESKNGKLEVGPLGAESWHSAQWYIEKAGNGFYRFKNRWTGSYMHIENEKGYVQVGSLGHSGWWSAQWNLKPIVNRCFVIDNRWRPGNIIDRTNGVDFVSYKKVNTGNSSAQWEMEEIIE